MKLQQIIEEANKKKVEIETSTMAFVKAKLVQESKVGIQHVKVARMLEGEVDRIKSKDSMNDKKIQLVNMCLEKMKADFLTF